MATFVVCTRCSKTLEIVGIDQLPETWQHTGSMLLCQRCADTGKDETVGDVLEEEVIHPYPGADTLDEASKRRAGFAVGLVRVTEEEGTLAIVDPEGIAPSTSCVPRKRSPAELRTRGGPEGR